MSRVLIIAEAGVNHNGDVGIAKHLIDAAKGAGADIVKFQTFDPKKLVTSGASMADYQKKNTGRNETQDAMLNRLALNEVDFYKLAEYCKEVGIEFLSTPFDIDSIHFLKELQHKWKVPSGEITNYPYLVEIAKLGQEVIVSTGMSTMDEVGEAVSVLNSNGAGSISLLHCTTNYPTPPKDVNLNAMLTLSKKFGYPTGYSDHTRGIEIPVAAVALGATIIEKHFTLDRNMDGPDHKASLEPDELRKMVDAIRNVEDALGLGKKEPTRSESANIVIARKSIVAKTVIKKGESFTEFNLTTKRPGNGVSPMRWNEIIGRIADRDYNPDELIDMF